MIRKLTSEITLPASVNRLQVGHLLMILNISRQTLCNWRKDKNAPFPSSFKSCGQYFILIEDLERWLVKHNVKIRKI